MACKTHNHEVHWGTRPVLWPPGVDLDDGLVQSHAKEAGAEEDGHQANELQAPHNCSRWGLGSHRPETMVVSDALGALAANEHAEASNSAALDPSLRNARACHRSQKLLIP